MEWHEVKNAADILTWLTGKTTKENVSRAANTFLEIYAHYRKRGIEANKVVVTISHCENEKTQRMTEEGVQADTYQAVTFDADGSHLGIAFFPNVQGDRILGFAVINDDTVTERVPQH